MAMTKVRVRRDRPSGLAWAVALALTALAVYLLTLPRAEEPDSLFASARVTRQMEAPPLEAWLVSLARCDTREAARVCAAGLAARGAAACGTELDGAWQVLGACFDSAREAERQAARLRAEEGLDASPVRLWADGTSLRVTAPEAQLDAVAAGLELLRRQNRELGALATQVDRGEAAPEAARALCAVAAGEAGGAARALTRFPQDDRLCPGLEALLTARASMLEAVSGANCPAGAALSGLIRCAQVEGLLGLAAWQAALGDGRKAMTGPEARASGPVCTPPPVAQRPRRILRRSMAAAYSCFSHSFWGSKGGTRVGRPSQSMATNARYARLTRLRVRSICST